MTPPKKPPRVYVCCDNNDGRVWGARPTRAEAKDLAELFSDGSYVVGPYVLAPKRRAKKRKGAG